MYGLRNAICVLLWFRLTPRSGGLCPFSNFAIGILRTMGEHTVASSWVRAKDAFRFFCVSVAKVFPASATTTGDFVSWKGASVSRLELPPGDQPPILL